MKWMGKQLKRMAVLAVVTATLAGIIVGLDALLSPEGDPRRNGRTPGA